MNIVNVNNYLSLTTYHWITLSAVPHDKNNTLYTHTSQTFYWDGKIYPLNKIAVTNIYLVNPHPTIPFICVKTCLYCLYTILTGNGEGRNWFKLERKMRRGGHTNCVGEKLDVIWEGRGRGGRSAVTYSNCTQDHAHILLFLFHHKIIKTQSQYMSTY